MAASTRLRVSGFTFASPLITRDTVIGDTPACSATSCMVTALRPRRLDFFTSPSLALGCMILEFPHSQGRRLTSYPLGGDGSAITVVCGRTIQAAARGYRR